MKKQYLYFRCCSVGTAVRVTSKSFCVPHLIFPGLFVFFCLGFTFTLLWKNAAQIQMKAEQRSDDEYRTRLAVIKRIGCISRAHQRKQRWMTKAAFCAVLQSPVLSPVKIYLSEAGNRLGVNRSGAHSSTRQHQCNEKQTVKVLIVVCNKPVLLSLSLTLYVKNCFF